MEIIKASNLVKTFNDKTVIDNCTLNVKKGSIYGLLGANGAGKTTLFKLLTGLLKPTNGTIEILEKTTTDSAQSMLRQIGSLIDTPQFYQHLDAKDNLEIHLSYMGVKGVDVMKTLSVVGLSDVERKPISKYSLGMRQRLAIARAIIHNPRILILDEPVNGLDPIGIKEMRTLFLDLVNINGMTILLSSHILSEIQHIADIVGVMVDGKIVEEVKLEKVTMQYHNLENYFFDVMSRGSKKC